jgi:hypothetical protein
LIPPWTPAWAELPAADLARFRKARHTLRRLQGVSAEAARLVPLTPPPRRWAFWRRNQDFAQWLADRGKAVEAEKDRLLTQIRQADDATVDQAVLKRWEELSTRRLDRPADDGQDPAAHFQAIERERHRARRDLAEHLGRLPLDGDKPAPGSELSAARHGSATRRDRVLDVYVLFRYPHEGLPALGEWLVKQGVKPVKYEFLKDTNEDED